MELGGLGQFPGPQYLPFSNQEGGLNSTKACLSVIGGQQGWGGECGEVEEGSSSLSLSGLLLFAGRVFLRHPLLWPGLSGLGIQSVKLKR